MSWVTRMQPPEVGGQVHRLSVIVESLAAPGLIETRQIAGRVALLQVDVNGVEVKPHVAKGLPQEGAEPRVGEVEVGVVVAQFQRLDAGFAEPGQHFPGEKLPAERYGRSSEFHGLSPSFHLEPRPFRFAHADVRANDSGQVRQAMDRVRRNHISCQSLQQPLHPSFRRIPDPGLEKAEMALIDIGSTTQLFVDDYLIESMTNTRRIMNPAVKVPDNPVIRAERPWEGTHVALKNVIYDRRDRIFRMWYAPGRYVARRQGDQIATADEYEGPRHATCLATSEDGIHWQRPELGLVDFNGSTRNNLLPPKSCMPELFPPESRPGFSFFEDPRDKDPGKRFKGLIRTFAAWDADPDGGHAGSGRHRRGGPPGDEVPPLFLARRVRVDGLRGQPRHRLFAEAGPLGADRFHGLGPGPPGVRRPHGEQPALARSPREKGDRPGRKPGHDPLERGGDDPRSRRGRHPGHGVLLA